MWLNRFCRSKGKKNKATKLNIACKLPSNKNTDFFGRVLTGRELNGFPIPAPIRVVTRFLTQPATLSWVKPPSHLPTPSSWLFKRPTPEGKGVQTSTIQPGIPYVMIFLRRQKLQCVFIMSFMSGMVSNVAKLRFGHCIFWCSHKGG